MRVCWQNSNDPDHGLAVYPYAVTVDGVEIAAAEADEQAGTATVSLIDEDGHHGAYVLCDYLPRCARVTGVVRIWMYGKPPRGCPAHLVRPPIPAGTVRHSYASQQRLLEEQRKKRCRLAATQP